MSEPDSASVREPEHETGQTTPITFRAPSLLLVEGREEKRFWQALFERAGRSSIQVEAIKGKYDLTMAVRVVTLTPGFKTVTWLGVVQDADDAPASAFDRIRTALRRAGLPVPSGPWQATSDASRTIVGFVLPDGQAQGDLESLVWQAIAAEPAVPCINSYFDCLQGAGITLPRQISKARIHAYLASLGRPDYRLHTAAAAGALPFDLNSPIFARLRSLLPSQ